MIKKFNSISKFKVVITTLLDAKIAYLLLETQPIVMSNIEKNNEIKPIKNKLYSISQIIRFGPHIKLIQNK